MSSNRLQNPKATSSIGGLKRNEKSMDCIGSASDNSGEQNVAGASTRAKGPNSGRAYRFRPPARDALWRPDHQQSGRSVFGWISGWNHRQGKRPHRLRPRTGPTDQYSGATANYSHGSWRSYL